MHFDIIAVVDVWTRVVCCALLSTGCSASLSPDDDASDARDGGIDALDPMDATDAAAEVPWTFETLETRSVAFGAASRSVELIRALRPDGARTYLLYIPALAPGSPLVLFNQPYDGIDWSGEEVDVRWAARGNGVYPDVEAPEYDGDDLVGYTIKSVQDAVNEAVLPLLNGFAVAHVYGRFYAGGSLEDDILDASAGYHFALDRADEIDVDRVGSFGGSWGALMALFGASRAPEGVTVRAVAVSSPPSDFQALDVWATEDGPAVWRDPAQLEAFYSPYLRRIHAALPESGAYTRYRQPAVCEGLSSLPDDAVLVLHDEWDLLIPVEQTRELDRTCPRVIQPMYWPRDGAPDYAVAEFDHGPFAREPVLPTLFTLAYLHLALALQDDDTMALTAGVRAALEATLSLLRDAQLRGEDVAFATEPLRQLCAPRATYFDGDTMATGPSAPLLSSALNTVYGTETTPANVCDALLSGLPAP